MFRRGPEGGKKVFPYNKIGAIQRLSRAVVLNYVGCNEHKEQAMWRDQLQPMIAKQSVTSRIIRTG